MNGQLWKYSPYSYRKNCFFSFHCANRNRINPLHHEINEHEHETTKIKHETLDHFFTLKLTFTAAGEMANWLRVHDALTEEWNYDPNIYASGGYQLPINHDSRILAFLISMEIDIFTHNHACINLNKNFEVKSQKPKIVNFMSLLFLSIPNDC